MKSSQKDLVRSKANVLELCKGKQMATALTQAFKDIGKDVTFNWIPKFSIFEIVGPDSQEVSDRILTRIRLRNENAMVALPPRKKPNA